MSSETRMEMKRRILVIHEDQDRNQGAREGQIQCPRKGILRRIQRQGRKEDKDKVGTRTRQGQGEKDKEGIWSKR